MATWPKVTAITVHTMHGHFARDPKDWIAAAAPKRKPIDKMGPQPVL